MTTDEQITNIIIETEERIQNIFESSSILEASYREEAYFKIKGLFSNKLLTNS